MSSEQGSETAGESVPRSAEQELAETRPIRDADRESVKTDDEQWARLDLNKSPDAGEYLAEDEPWTPEEQAALDAGGRQETPGSQETLETGSHETGESQLDQMGQQIAPAETGETPDPETSSQTPENGAEQSEAAQPDQGAEVATQDEDRDSRRHASDQLQAPTDEPTETGRHTRETGETAVATEHLPPGYGTMPVRLDNGERSPGPGDLTGYDWNRPAELQRVEADELPASSGSQMEQRPDADGMRDAASDREVEPPDGKILNVGLDQQGKPDWGTARYEDGEHYQHQEEWVRRIRADYGDQDTEKPKPTGQELSEKLVPDGTDERALGRQVRNDLVKRADDVSDVGGTYGRIASGLADQSGGSASTIQRDQPVVNKPDGPGVQGDHVATLALLATVAAVKGTEAAVNKFKRWMEKHNAGD